MFIRKHTASILAGVGIAALLAIGLFLVSNGGNSLEDDNTNNASGKSSVPLSTGSSEDTRTSEPQVPQPFIPEGPVTSLDITDIREGDGAEAVPGKTITVHYHGTLASDGTEFDSSIRRGQTFSFVLGAGQVIQGWDEGFAGMKIGGRRRLVIPAEMAYGSSSPSPSIPPNSALVFVVDLIAVE